MNRTEKENELSLVAIQIRDIAMEIHRARMRNDYSENSGTRHFANLLKWNITRINELSAECETK